MALAAASTVALTLPLAGVASADPKPSPKSSNVPSKGQVDAARSEAVAKRQGVQQMEADLAAANARLAQSAERASIAAEAYNGAMWQLSEGRKTYRLAQVREQRAKDNVELQRSRIVTLVTDSYQNGTELNSATALISDEGPKGLMNRYGVVESAGDSMRARYDRFRDASALAKTYTETAARAEKHQEFLAQAALKLRDTASALANNAALLVGQIAVQKEGLVRAFAGAQNVSLELAGKRQEALDRIAQQRAAAAARGREEAAGAQLRKAALEAAKKAKGAKQDHQRATADNNTDTGSSPGGGYTVPADETPPAPGTGVQRAIAYAKAQLGKPYLWAADGPDSFDCSGLTMMAWRAGGKSLPHWSVAQFQQNTRISEGQVRPGDLVFWGGSPGTIHHVAIYIGNGEIIHAPRTGQPVQINSMYYWVPPDFYSRP